MGKREQAYTAPTGRVQHLRLQHTSTEQALHIPSLLLLNSTNLQRPSRQQKAALSCFLWHCISSLGHHAGLQTPENHFPPRSPLKASVRQEHSFPPTYRKTHKTYPHLWDGLSANHIGPFTWAEGVYSLSCALWLSFSFIFFQKMKFCPSHSHPEIVKQLFRLLLKYPGLQWNVNFFSLVSCASLQYRTPYSSTQETIVLWWLLFAYESGRVLCCQDPFFAILCFL